MCERKKKFYCEFVFGEMFIGVSLLHQIYGKCYVSWKVYCLHVEKS